MKNKNPNKTISIERDRKRNLKTVFFFLKIHNGLKNLPYYRMNYFTESSEKKNL